MSTPTIDVKKASEGHIPFFLTSVLSVPAGSLPRGPLWVVQFEFDENLKNTIKQAPNYEPRLPSEWKIDKALDTITAKDFHTNRGCVLAQAVNIPGESLITSYEGTQSNGFIRSRVGLGRQDFEALNISFLQTNVNFVDNVVRPWTVMTGHLGMIARPKNKKYRCDTVTIHRLGFESPDKPLIQLQTFYFHGVCPIAVEGEQLNYTATGNSITKGASFAYQWYTVNSDNNSLTSPSKSK